MTSISNPTSSDFKDVNGCCAMQAIAYAFKTDSQGIIYLYKALKRRQYDGNGLDQKEMNTLILALGAAHRVDIQYVKFKSTLKHFLKQFKTGTYILNQDGHACVVEKGKIVDDWGIYNEQILGYWKLDGRPTIVTHGALARKKELSYIIRSEISRALNEAMSKMRFQPYLR